MIALDAAWLDAHPLPEVSGPVDKNSRGRVLIAGGSTTVPAALALSGEAAFRAGAGKVQLATVDPVAIALGMLIPEAAVFGLRANDDGEIDAEAAGELNRLSGHVDAMVLGPGMGEQADAGALLAALLQSAPEIPVLLDAAMLHASRELTHRLSGFGGQLVLTPHPGEMASLMACDEGDVGPDLARAAAERFDAVVVLKSSQSWVAAPGHEVLEYAGGGPGLATGGSGDVLAGVIGGLLARGAEPVVAAARGVWLHGEAGRELAERSRPLGFLARELLPRIPALMDRA